MKIRESCLCIGGPSDGQTVSVIVGMLTLELGMPSPLEAATGLLSEAEAQQYGMTPRVTYRREVLGFPSKQWAVYVAESLSRDDAMEHLIKAYSKQ